MNTSEGNGLMNMFMTFFLLEEAGNFEYGGYFEGDDGVCWYTSVDYSSAQPPTTLQYEAIGAKIKIMIPPEPTLESFCGLIFDPVVLDNVTDPLECLMSFGYTTRQYEFACESKRLALLRSKSLSMLYSYPGAPILKALALYGLRVSDKIDDKYLAKVESRMKICSYDKEETIQDRRAQKFDDVLNKPVHTLTRLVVERKFGIGLELQYKIEKYLNEKNDLSPLDIPEVLDYVHPDTIKYYNTYAINLHPKSKFSFTATQHRPYKIWRDALNYDLIW